MQYEHKENNPHILYLKRLHGPGVQRRTESWSGGVRPFLDNVGRIFFCDLSLICMHTISLRQFIDMSMLPQSQFKCLTARYYAAAFGRQRQKKTPGLNVRIICNKSMLVIWQ